MSLSQKKKSSQASSWIILRKANTSSDVKNRQVVVQKAESLVISAFFFCLAEARVRDKYPLLGHSSLHLAACGPPSVKYFLFGKKKLGMA